mmetsp:Transcript_38623/g.99180  ORF Transcript_38623/g.99180 Transcript_38623/m.99180 type:complete len:532 (-) Transcript_38623:116-1711(-)
MEAKKGGLQTHFKQYLSAYCNIINAIVGSGILGLAYAVAHSGVGWFLFLLLFSAFLANYAIVLLTSTCAHAGVYTYEDLGWVSFGRIGNVLVTLSIMVQNTGSMTSYMLVVHDVLPAGLVSFGVSPDSIFANPAFLTSFLAVLVVLPLGLLRKITFLGYMSFFSLAMVLFFSCVIVDRWAFPHETIPSTVNATINWGTPDEGIAYSIPAMFFSFQCHTTILPVYHEMHRDIRANTRKVATAAIVTCVIFYSICGFFGYFTFFSHVQSDILLSYNYNYTIADVQDGLIVGYITDKFMQVVRFVFALAVMITVPLIQFPCRKTLTYLIYGRGEKMSGWDQRVEDGEAKSMGEETEDEKKALMGSLVSQESSSVRGDVESAAFAPVGRESSLNAVVISEDEGSGNGRKQGGDGSSQQAKAKRIIPNTVEGRIGYHLNPRRLPFYMHAIFTVLIVGTVTTLAICVPNINIVFGIAGATAAPSLIFVLPAATHLKITTGRIFSCKKPAALLLFLFGVTAIVVCMSLVIYNVATGVA